jgi:steroid 5-alpha reductase family enzyme
MSVAQALASAAAGITALMLLTWLVSVIRRDASIVDIAWGFGFVVVAWVVRFQGDTNTARQWLLVILASVWGLRLTAYLWWRNRGQPEDYRYQAMRRHHGPRFPIVSLGTVFALQGLMMWIVSLPVQLGQVSNTPDLGVLAALGFVVWAVGMFFETVGDIQLARFKADPANAGLVMNRGLWRYTRHPNYFGDACVWWGLGLIAAETGVGAWGLIGSLLMTVLLVRVSGAALLERSLRKRKPGYEDYVARTSSFIPRPPRRVG